MESAVMESNWVLENLAGVVSQGGLFGGRDVWLRAGGWGGACYEKSSREELPRQGELMDKGRKVGTWVKLWCAGSWLVPSVRASSEHLAPTPCSVRSPWWLGICKWCGKSANCINLDFFFPEKIASCTATTIAWQTCRDWSFNRLKFTLLHP